MSASFIYYQRPPRGGSTVSLRRLPDGQYVIDFEGYPDLQRAPRLSGRRAVENFAAWRERSARDYGASAVDWGDCPHLKRYWPEHATPWDTEIG